MDRVLDRTSPAPAAAARLRPLSCRFGFSCGPFWAQTGPILAQAVVPVHAEDTEALLAQRILRQEHRLLPAVVQALASGVAPKGENEFLVSYGGMQA